MCGRYTLRTSEIELAVGETVLHGRVTPRYNIAPTQQIPVYRVGPTGNAEWLQMHWGLIPSWSKEPKSRYGMINARAETVQAKPSFRAPFKRQRCLIPADGWYEWQAVEGQRKQPHFIHLNNHQPFFFAGLWEHWEEKEGKRTIDSCAIITTAANEAVQLIHDRMPVILDSSEYDAWLDPTYTNTDHLKHLLCPYAKDDLRSFPVSLQVNNPRVDGPQCVVPLG